MQSLPSADIIKRNGRRIVVDLGRPVYLQEDVQFIQSLVDHSDVLVELDHPGLTTPSQVQFVYSDVLDVTAADNSSDLPGFCRQVASGTLQTASRTGSTCSRCGG